jgi:para-nitrobenzyl esterase
MRKKCILLCFAISLLFCSDIKAQCADGRYLSTIFPQTPNMVTDTFGTAQKYDGTTQTLLMDVYQPVGDNFARRPLMVLAFGGSFTTGLRQSPDMVQICQEFAKSGMVCVSIDYRLGVLNGSDSCMYQAVVRGLQDMNAAIRYFYKDASTVNHYRIDTTQVFCGGTSAGAFIGLNKGYLKVNPNDFSRPIPATLVNAQLELGGPDGGNNGSVGYSDKIKGIVDLCGAVFDTLWIQPGDPMLVGVHGTGDSTVPYYYDSIEGTQDIKKDFFGGGNIIQRFHSLGFPNAQDTIYTFIGAPHAPFVLPIPLVPPASLYMDTTLSILHNYFYLNLVCDSTIAGINDIADNIFVSAFPNPSDDIMTVISHDPKNIILEVMGLDGRVVGKIDLPAYSTQKIQKGPGIVAGMYLLNYYDATGTIKLKTDKVTFY